MPMPLPDTTPTAYDDVEAGRDYALVERHWPDRADSKYAFEVSRIWLRRVTVVGKHEKVLAGLSVPRWLEIEVCEAVNFPPYPTVLDGHVTQATVQPGTRVHVQTVGPPWDVVGATEEYRRSIPDLRLAALERLGELNLRPPLRAGGDLGRADVDIEALCCLMDLWEGVNAELDVLRARVAECDEGHCGEAA